MAPNPEVTALLSQLSTPPPPGSPHAVPLPGTGTATRSPIYRHWRFKDGPLLSGLTPDVRTFHEMFLDSAKRFPKNKCLGTRPWNPTTKSWENKYVWETYADVAERSKNFGTGIVEAHRRVGITADKFGVGLWCQNRAEWQITGALHPIAVYVKSADLVQISHSAPSRYIRYLCTRLSGPIPASSSSNTPNLPAS
jgi:long-chain acyl-CoA synthetase